jgi:hypothetical protein
MTTTLLITDAMVSGLNGEINFNLDGTIATEVRYSSDNTIKYTRTWAYPTGVQKTFSQWVRSAV